MAPRQRAEPSTRDLRRRLLSWYARNRRDLPWRRTRDPYAIWVSEVMLQQTQVATVLRYYGPFLARFPDPAALAAADEEAVLASWSGLGYYRRARALRDGARAVVREHGALLPGDAAALRALPGIGRYTAGAIASMGFDLEEPVVDGNVRRVLARLYAIDARHVGWAAESTLLWRIAGELVRGKEPGELNQALMELGALVCTPRQPRCGDCPVESACRARASGRPERLPASKPRPPTVAVRVVVAWIARRGRVLLERPAEKNPLRGAWDLPAREVGPVNDDGSRSIRARLARLGLVGEVGPALTTVRHTILNRRLTLEIRAVTLQSVRSRPNAALRWIAVDGLDHAPVSGATRKVARAVLAARSSPGAELRSRPVRIHVADRQKGGRRRGSMPASASNGPAI